MSKLPVRVNTAVVVANKQSRLVVLKDALVDACNRGDMENALYAIDMIEEQFSGLPRLQTQLQAFIEDCADWPEWTRKMIRADLFVDVFQAAEAMLCIFAPSGRMTCGHITSTCRNRLLSGLRCEKKFAKGQVRCGSCGGSRKFCEELPRANGRCARHGGVATADLVIARKTANVYVDSLPEQYRGLYQAFVSDPDILSVATEMGAIRLRISELMTELGSMWTPRQAIEMMAEANGHMQDDEYVEAQICIQQAMEMMYESAKADHRWDEISRMSARVKELARYEKDRVTEAMAMHSPQEVENIVVSISDRVEVAVRQASIMVSLLVIDLVNEVYPDKKVDGYMTTVNLRKQVERTILAEFSETYNAPSETLTDVV